MALNSIDRITDRVSSVGSAADQLQYKATDAANRVQSTVDGAARGIDAASNLYDNVSEKAGETWNKVSDGASSIADKFGNLFGGSDEASTNAVQAAGSAESGVSPTNRIAGFANDPKGTLPSLDPIKREVSEPFKAKNEAASGVMDYLKPGKAGNLLSQGFDKLKTLRDGALKAVGTDYASVKKRLESTMQLAGQLSRLPGEIQQEVYGYTSAFNQAKNEVTSVIDGAKHTFDTLSDFDNYLAIDELITSFTGKTNDIRSLDINTSSALIYGISSKLSDFGLPQKTEPMVEAITDPVAKAVLWGELLVQAAGIGNLDSIEYYIGKLQPGQGRELAPTVIPSLLRNLQYEDGVGYKAMGVRILAICNSLNPNWDKSTSAPVRTELLPYTYCNSNAIQALLTTVKRPYVCAAGSRRLTTSNILVDQFFPV
ncbi:hypothetical protein BIZ78_gp043 [Erwinia phage vB_EamM_Caitlin]|uniref:hypothetical protein n=1 Tax=Erwinia phage vB_EamM_Caitlin TaxID=1883379 RepID=UPI00081C6085|nr:hypothetical protein BIZ78_gp043 [Erwinia phage vB_EamM_Caitlin]ANZ48532.1 hypothetical protein CAITLIN_237 [Erwinia phage vB_EamM_Caitlin]